MTVPLQDEKILITGPYGQIAGPLTRRLAKDNEVWGIARFSQPGSRERIESLGVKTLEIDLASADFRDLPDDFTVVLHLATFASDSSDFDLAIRVNAESTGLLIGHCRKSRCLVMSTGSVYRPHPDPWHPFAETDPLGNPEFPLRPTYSVAKIAQEAVARTSARLFGAKVVIARMNAAYGPDGGMATWHLDSIVSGTPIILRNDPLPFSPIHDDDIFDQLPAILSAASTPATIVNWAGDEPVGSLEWCDYLGQLTGTAPQIQFEPIPGSHLGVVVDPSKRTTLTGPCKVSWRDGMRRVVEARHPGKLVQVPDRSGR
jgi:nucleoside-diphosphate-sugar epimerase